MNLKRTAAFTWRRSHGLTLIELMIAMVLGILVSAGIITVFVSTAKSSRAQEQQARLQEGGRFAVDRLTESLRMANASYCSGSGGVAESSGSVFVDGLRAPTILASGLSFPDNTTAFATDSYPNPAPTTQYALPSYFYMRGYDCNTSTCTPEDPNTDVSAIPAMGTAVGDRVVGADVLTLRYLNPRDGWSIGGDDTMNVAATGSLTSAVIAPEPGEPALADIATGNQLMMYADCSAGMVYWANFDGTSFTTNAVGAGSSQNMALPLVPGNPELRTAPKLFPFGEAFVTETWFLQVVDDGSAGGTTTGALMRRVNGVTQEMARGVERLDFRFGVQDQNGNTRFLTANQVDTATCTLVGGVCPHQPPNVPSNFGYRWRSIKTIEVSMLVDGQQALPSLTDQVLAYAYSPDGSTVPQPPDSTSHVIQPVSDQGFARGLIRREFSTVVSVRNFNP